MTDTIFALSSGTPPSAIAVMRVTGPGAALALEGLGATLPPARQASLRKLCDRNGGELDRALVLWLPGPATATGEDVLELHLHGGRAVIAAVERALAAIPSLRRAEAGEFTRRAFANGRIDLAEAEGLADLLSAETELQRQQAMNMASGKLSSQVAAWRDAVLILSAQVEAALDFGDEDDVEALGPEFTSQVHELSRALEEALVAPRAEVLRDGFRVVIAGPPNTGKSSLFNRLVEDEAAIIAPIAGTTRDLLTRPVAIEGVPFVFADTAGLRDATIDPIEAIGIERARVELERADLLLWLGGEGEIDGERVWELESFADAGQSTKRNPRHRVSAASGEGLDQLRRDLVALAHSNLARPGTLALNRRQHELVSSASADISEAAAASDPLITAECLRRARAAFDRLLGRAATEDMLDTLFQRFCIGK